MIPHAKNCMGTFFGYLMQTKAKHDMVVEGHVCTIIFIYYSMQYT